MYNTNKNLEDLVERNQCMVVEDKANISYLEFQLQEMIIINYILLTVKTLSLGIFSYGELILHWYHLQDQLWVPHDWTSQDEGVFTAHASSRKNQVSLYSYIFWLSVNIYVKGRFSSIPFSLTQSKNVQYYKSKLLLMQFSLVHE